MDIPIIVEDSSLQTMGFQFAYAPIEEDGKGKFALREFRTEQGAEPFAPGRDPLKGRVFGFPSPWLLPPLPSASEAIEAAARLRSNRQAILGEGHHDEKKAPRVDMSPPRAPDATNPARAPSRCLRRSEKISEWRPLALRSANPPIAASIDDFFLPYRRRRTFHRKPALNHVPSESPIATDSENSGMLPRLTSL